MTSAPSLNGNAEVFVAGKYRNLLREIDAAAYAAMRGFDIDDGRPVDSFDGTDAQTILLHFTDFHRMQPQRIWTIRRARGKNAGKGLAAIRARMNLQNIAARHVEPGHHNNVIANREAIHSLLHFRVEFQPRVGRSFGTLFRRFAAVFDARANKTNGAKRCSFASPCPATPSRASFLFLRHPSFSAEKDNL